VKEGFRALLIAVLADFCSGRAAAYIEEEKQLSSVEIREVAGVSGYTNIISSGTPYTSIVM